MLKVFKQFLSLLSLALRNKTHHWMQIFRVDFLLSFLVDEKTFEFNLRRKKKKKKKKIIITVCAIVQARVKEKKKKEFADLLAINSNDLHREGLLLSVSRAESCFQDHAHFNLQKQR